MNASKEKIVLIGGGGHSKVVVDAILRMGEFAIFGIIDNNVPRGSRILGIEVLGPDKILPDIFKKGTKYAFISMASMGNCDTRKRIYANLKKIGFNIPVVIHPKAVIGEGVEFQEGVFVAAGAVVNPCVRIGKNAIINTSSSIDHDCTIGDFAHIAPGVTLCGSVKIGEETHVGTGATVIQNITISGRQLISAGTVVKKNIPVEHYVEEVEHVKADE